MPIVAGVLFVLTGACCLAYAAAAADAFPADPFAAIGALLVGLGLGLARRSLVARRIALGSLGAMLLLVIYLLVTTYGARGSSLATAEDVVLQVRLLVLALLGAMVVVLGGLARRVRAASAYGALDLLPLAGLAAALGVGVPCRNGRAAACVAVAARIIEAAEHIPTGPPTPWQERAVTVLDTHDCRGVEPPACAVHVYAIGTVAARAGRYDRARPLFLRACDLDRNWCARAAQDGSIPWTPAERQRLTRRGGG